MFSLKELVLKSQVLNKICPGQFSLVSYLLSLHWAPKRCGTMRHDNNLEGSHKSVVEAGIIGTNRKDGGGWDGDHRRLIRNIYLSMSFLLVFFLLGNYG